MPNDGLTGSVSRALADVRFTDLDTAVVSAMDRAILDSIGVAHMGYEFVSSPFLQYATSVGGLEESTILGDGRRVSAGLAAGVNSTLAYNSNMMESGPGDHLFDALAHAGIAMGERLGASGRDVVTAVAIAYELNAVFYKAARAKDRHGYVNTKKHTPVCVAVCAGKLLEFDADQMNNAIGIAWLIEPPAMDLSLKLNVFTGLGSMYNLMICQLGIQAALLTKCGVEGPPNTMEQDGLYDLERLAAFAPERCDHVSNELHLKPWLGSRTSTGAIQLALEIVEENAIGLDDIEEVIVNAHRFYRDYPFGCRAPHSYFEGLFSVPWIIANALLGYQSGPEWVTPEALQDVRRHDFTKKVVVGEHPEAVAMWATGRALGNPDVPIEVVIRARGAEFRKSMRYREIRGSPENPMSDTELEAKFLRLAGRVRGDEAARALLAASREISKAGDVRDVTAGY